MGGQVLAGLVVGVLLGVVLGFAVAWAVATRRADASVRAAQVEAARAGARLDAERASSAERVAAAQSDDQRIAEQFRALAADALTQSSEQFLALASQRLAADRQSQVGELAQREQAVRELVEPLGRTLDEVRTQLTTAQRERAAAEAALRSEVDSMRTATQAVRAETAQLVTALRSSQVRGRWGELQLRRVVEAAGMLAQVDFVEQEQVRTDDGLQRPDLVVRLAGGKQVVVDAKVAFLGFLEAAQTSDETVRTERLAAHTRHVRAHVDALAAKRYWEQFTPAPEFVVMFVPAESFLQAALEQDAGLIEYAAARNVILATPTTLLALLRTVAYAWRQDALASNAQSVLDLGKQLHGRLATMGGHLARLGRSLGSAADAYNSTVSSLETRVLVTARRFAALEVVDEALPTPAPVNPQLSAVTAPELVASVEEQIVTLDGFDSRARRDEESFAAEAVTNEPVERADGRAGA
ncbi:DNA recombination protein RmuC [Cellulomonas composti]|uniref:DNA recombination protein RmuC n=1 Tax=Cellulomonas composti TaxID=266130 RepID=A0A511JA93_9CELL|nr:DNA recombination protein RmuC [Cellulomonas composti]GEL94894.1 hypothetical protein CCO02nite_15520 [Cellulomonas composti]